MTEKDKNINIFPVYTLEKGIHVGMNVADKHLYLHANKLPLICPFLSKVKDAIPCGNHCAKFDLMAQVDNDNKPTGTVFGVQSCGTLRRIPLANLKLNISEKPEASASENGKDEKPEGKTIPINR